MQIASAEFAFDGGELSTRSQAFHGSGINRRSFVLRQAGLHEVCELSRGLPGYRIALIDGAVDTTHRSLSGCRIHRTGKDDSSIASRHATFLASVLLSDENARRSGTTLGLCSNCTVVNYAVVSDEMLAGSLPVAVTAERLALTVRAAVNEGCHLILFGVAIRYQGHPDWSELRHALRRAAQAGVLTIVPAGNSADALAAMQVPWAEILTVGSHDRRGVVSTFSLSHRRMRSVVFAPGENIPGAADGQDFVVWSGSSGAAAVAAGGVALGCSLSPDRSAFDIAGALFAPPRRNLDGRRCLKIPSSHVMKTEVSYGT